MRCVSPHSRYSIQVFEGNEQVMMDARGHAFSHVLAKPTIANFETSGLLDWEVEAALTHFNFAGLPDGVNPLTRISVFDTEAYAEQRGLSSDELEAIDTRLRHLASQHPSEFIVVDKPATAKPWPSYDEDSVEEILAARERFRFSPEAVRLYESENQGREEIIEAMFDLEEGREPAEAIVVNA